MQQYFRNLSIQQMALFIVALLALIIIAAIVINPGAEEQVDFTITPTAEFQRDPNSTSEPLRAIISPPAPTPTRS